jgi:NitT/TauT family transport system substrate-binding protein
LHPVLAPERGQAGKRSTSQEETMQTIDRRRFLFLSGGLILAACGGQSEDEADLEGDSSSGADPRPARLRLGFFPNITHAQPNVGLERDTYQQALGEHVRLEAVTFNAGPSAIEALFAGSIDATYIGPNPAINGYMRSNGAELRIFAGATSGGALLVVRPDARIEKPGDFANKKVATPQLGNTQDVALRAWLKANGLDAREQGGNVNVQPIANADALSLFQRGQLDAAWAVEPWATRLLLEAGGRVFLDERTLWPNGDFVTTHLIVKTKFLKDRPDVVESLIRAHVDLTGYINANPAEARALVNQSIEKITSAALPQQVIDAAWENLRITYDPIASSLKKSADDAYALGFLDQKPELKDIYDLGLLNEVLKEKGEKEVEGLE